LPTRLNRPIKISRLGLAIFAAVLLSLLAGGGVFAYYWVGYGRMIDQLLAGHINQSAARIYAAPSRIAVGEAMTADGLIDHLQMAGYTENRDLGATGWYAQQKNAVEIHPGKDSYFAGKNALRLEFGGKEIRGIRKLADRSDSDTAEIEPPLLTNLFDSSREKRRQVRFEDIPHVLIDAVLSAEDKRFFEHPGFDVIRIGGAALADLRGQRMEGASTLTMQLARSIFFTPERTLRRKVAETMVALQLEQRFSKEKIFELYANEIYLGNRGSFAIHGFAEGSLAYFNKDIRDLTVPEAAFLAGIIRAPNRYSSAERHPDRAIEARDRVLKQMEENHYITPEQEQAAREAPLRVVPQGIANSDAPYFVDMIKDHLLDRFSEDQLLSQGFRVYTTLDLDLIRAAAESITIGMENVDRQLKSRYALWAKQGRPAQAQVALIALDPHTGQIRALVGGRNYGQSQLNHVLARRQPGSVFKPIVYAAAFDNAVDGISPIVTPATTVVDEPTTFVFNNDQEYSPNNYGEEYRGPVTLRDALTSSLNVATVKVAEMIGYERVVQVARQIGITDSLLPTPAVALGAYEMTPLEVAGAYTVFANGGTRAEPTFLDRVINADDMPLEQSVPQSRQALDPRVAYLVTNVLQDVINRGTGASVRARGFTAPAAGKTGTSRDGWFAGYTSNLLCIVWVGFDDNRDLDLSGAASAAPIWTEFMKRASALPAYSNVQDFTAPDGVVSLDIDPETSQLATPSCPVTRREVFIQSSAPTEFCEKHGGTMLTQTPPISWLSRLFGGGGDAEKGAEEPIPAGAPGETAKSQPLPAAQNAPAAGSPKPEKPVQTHTAAVTPPPSTAGASEEKKPGLLQRVFGIFGNSK
jgi:penicillin-binding protein 1B